MQYQKLTGKFPTELSAFSMSSTRRAAPCSIRSNVMQRGDALKLLQTLPATCSKLVFFDPQYRGGLDKLAYGNEGARQRERAKLPAMTSGYIDCCC